MVFPIWLDSSVGRAFDSKRKVPSSIPGWSVNLSLTVVWYSGVIKSEFIYKYNLVLNCFIDISTMFAAARVAKYPVVMWVTNASAQTLHRSGTSCMRSKVNLVTHAQRYASQTRIGAKRATQSKKTLREMAESPASGSGNFLVSFTVLDALSYGTHRILIQQTSLVKSLLLLLADWFD